VIVLRCVPFPACACRRGSAWVVPSGLTCAGVCVSQVGNCIRACGCFIPELILVDQVMPSLVEDDFSVRRASS